MRKYEKIGKFIKEIDIDKFLYEAFEKLLKENGFLNKKYLKNIEDFIYVFFKKIINWSEKVKVEYELQKEFEELREKPELLEELIMDVIRETKEEKKSREK
jgi:hypothetical protein